MSSNKPSGLSFFCHETIWWAMGSLFLAMTGSIWMIVVNAIRFVANIALSYHQNQTGGAQNSKVTPYFTQLGVSSFNAVCSVLEVFGALTGSSSITEAIYRSKLYTLNSCFYFSAGLNDTRFGRIVSRLGVIARILLNPNVWLGPSIFISITYAFTPILREWGQIPHTAIPWISAVLGVISLSVSIQAVVQSYRILAGFWSRNYGIIIQAAMNTAAGITALCLGKTSWEFVAYMLLWSVGNIFYLWRNRRAPKHILEQVQRRNLASTVPSVPLAK